MMVDDGNHPYDRRHAEEGKNVGEIACCQLMTTRLEEEPFFFMIVWM